MVEMTELEAFTLAQDIYEREARANARHNAWGVVRIYPGRGMSEEDPCAFGGWYSLKGWAIAVYENWCQCFPDWTVALIEMKAMKLSNEPVAQPAKRTPSRRGCRRGPWSGRHHPARTQKLKAIQADDGETRVRNQNYRSLAPSSIS